MKKQVMIALMTLIPMTSFAKVADFGSMISENAAAQRELHESVRDNLHETREVVAKAQPREKIVVVEAKPDAYREFARFKAIAGKCYGTPAFSNGRLYIRSSTEAACFDASAK